MAAAAGNHSAGLRFIWREVGEGSIISSPITITVEGSPHPFTLLAQGCLRNNEHVSLGCVDKTRKKYNTLELMEGDKRAITLKIDVCSMTTFIRPVTQGDSYVFCMQTNNDIISQYSILPDKDAPITQQEIANVLEDEFSSFLKLLEYFFALYLASVTVLEVSSPNEVAQLQNFLYYEPSISNHQEAFMKCFSSMSEGNIEALSGLCKTLKDRQEKLDQQLSEEVERKLTGALDVEDELRQMPHLLSRNANRLFEEGFFPFQATNDKLSPRVAERLQKKILKPFDPEGKLKDISLLSGMIQDNEAGRITYEFRKKISKGFDVSRARFSQEAMMQEFAEAQALRNIVRFVSTSHIPFRMALDIFTVVMDRFPTPEEEEKLKQLSENLFRLSTANV